MPPETPPKFDDLDHSSAAKLTSLRDAVTPILANNLLPHFTDHSVEHSDNLIDLIQKLTSPLRDTADALEPPELVILYSACYLHDIGLQYELAHKLGVIPDDELGAPWADLTDQVKLQLVRRHHPRISAELVQRSAHEPLIGIQLTDEYHPARVASLCESHGLDVESDRFRELTAVGPHVRMRLLSGLLRVADILDESRPRARRHRAKTLNLDNEALVHWWRHYYTESVTFEPDNKLIRVHFDFPPQHQDEYAKIIPELQIPFIAEELDKHRQVLNKYGLAWNLDRKIAVQPHSTTEVMPADVLVEMAAQLYRRRVGESDAQRRADVEGFEETQPLLRREFEELQRQRDRLPPDDYMRRLLVQARNRWKLGSKRAACMMLYLEFERNAGHVPAVERLRMAVELAEWQCAERQSYEALRVLLKVEGVAESGEAEAALRLRYWRLRARCANANAEHEEADVATDRAMALPENENGRMALQAERAEWQYMRGDHGKLSPDFGCDGTQPTPAAATARSYEEDDDPTHLIGRVHASTRLMLVRWRVRALAEGAEAVLKLLDEHSHNLPSDRLFERAAVGLAKAELLLLDGRAPAAVDVLDSLIEVARGKNFRELEITLLDNRMIAKCVQLEGDEEFYSRFDSRRLRGMTFWDESAVLRAVVAAEKGKHYDALPALWMQVCHAHYRMTWQGQRWAHARLAREYLQIGFLCDAAWHVIAALDGDLARQIGKAVVAAGNADAIEQVVQRILGLGRLRSYAKLACFVLREITDVVPDDRIGEVTDFLLKSASQPEGDRGTVDRLNAAWDAIEKLVPRLHQEVRGNVARAAIGHFLYHEPNLCRPHIIKAVHHAVFCGIPKETLMGVAEATLPLATTTKSNFDYTETVNC